MKKLSESFYKAKDMSLLLFLFGMILLGLFGYGYFSYGTFGNKIVDENPSILPFGIPILLPYPIFVIYELYWEEKNKNQQKHYNEINIEKLLKIGIPLTINLNKSIKEVRELNHQNNLDFDLLKYFLIYPIGDLSKSFEELFNDETKIFTLVILEYKIERKKYLKKIIIPFSKESTISILKMQKNTLLYYDQEFPEESIVDLEFINSYL